MIFEPHYGPKKIAKLFGISAKTIIRECERGELESVRVGKLILIPKSGFIKYYERRKRRASS